MNEAIDLPRIVLCREFHPELIRKELLPKARVRIATHPVDLVRHLKSADGWIVGLRDPVTARILNRAPRLKVVGTYSVGTEHIDLRACQERGIAVVNTPGVLTPATAELALALALAAARRIPEGDSLCRSGAFNGWGSSMLLGQLLRGRKAVLVGRGRIGQEAARLFRAIGMKVEWITREDSRPAILEKLARAQLLSLHVSMNPSTHHWLDRQRIAALPRDAIVVNTTRGPVVDEKALIRALRERRIFAAGLDVYENEPRVPAALRKLPNVVLLPHLGSATEETRAAMARLVIRGVLGVLNGKRIPNTVNSDV